MIYFFKDFFGDNSGLNVSFVGLLDFCFFLLQHSNTGQATVVHFAFETRKLDQVVVKT